MDLWSTRSIPSSLVCLCCAAVIPGTDADDAIYLLLIFSDLSLVALLIAIASLTLAGCNGTNVANGQAEKQEVEKQEVEKQDELIEMENCFVDPIKDEAADPANELNAIRTAIMNSG